MSTFLLQENAGYILQENGYRILLEDSVLPVIPPPPLPPTVPPAPVHGPIPAITTAASSVLPLGFRVDHAPGQESLA